MAGLGLSLFAPYSVPWVVVGVYRRVYDAPEALRPEQILGDTSAISYPCGGVYGV